MHWASSPSPRRAIERRRCARHLERSGLGSRRDWRDWRDLEGSGTWARKWPSRRGAECKRGASPPQFGSGTREGQPRAQSQKPLRRPGPEGPPGLPPHVSSARCPNPSETRKVGLGDFHRGGDGDTGETPRPLGGDPPAGAAGWHLKATRRAEVWAGPTGSSRDSVESQALLELLRQRG